MRPNYHQNGTYSSNATRPNYGNESPYDSSNTLSVSTLITLTATASISTIIKLIIIILFIREVLSLYRSNSLKIRSERVTSSQFILNTKLQICSIFSILTSLIAAPITVTQVFVFYVFYDNDYNSNTNSDDYSSICNTNKALRISSSIFNIISIICWLLISLWRLQLSFYGSIYQISNKYMIFGYICIFINFIILSSVAFDLGSIIFYNVFECSKYSDSIENRFDSSKEEKIQTMRAGFAATGYSFSAVIISVIAIDFGRKLFMLTVALKKDDGGRGIDKIEKMRNMDKATSASVSIDQDSPTSISTVELSDNQKVLVNVVVKQSILTGFSVGSCIIIVIFVVNLVFLTPDNDVLYMTVVWYGLFQMFFGIIIIDLFLSFSFAQKQYDCMCRCCDRGCQRLCTRLALKMLGSKSKRNERNIEMELEIGG